MNLHGQTNRDFEPWKDVLTRETAQKERLVALKDGWLAQALGGER